MWGAIFRIFAIGSAGYSLNDFFSAMGKMFGLSKDSETEVGKTTYGWFVAVMAIFALLFYYVWTNRKK